MHRKKYTHTHTHTHTHSLLLEETEEEVGTGAAETWPTQIRGPSLWAPGCELTLFALGGGCAIFSRLASLLQLQGVLGRQC